MKLRGRLETSEFLVMGTRSHPLALVPALLHLLFAAIIGSFASSMMPVAPILAYLALALALWLVFRSVVRFLRWMTTFYLLTNYRLIIQTGSVKARHVNLPLSTIEAVKIQNLRVAPGQQAHMQIFSLGAVYLFPRIPQAKIFSQYIYRAQQGKI